MNTCIYSNLLVCVCVGGGGVGGGGGTGGGVRGWGVLSRK